MSSHGYCLLLCFAAGASSPAEIFSVLWGSSVLLLHCSVSSTASRLPEDSPFSVCHVEDVPGVVPLTVLSFCLNAGLIDTCRA